MKSIRVRVVAALCFGLAAACGAAEAPAFQNLRYEENGAAWREVEPAAALDRLKYIPLGDSDTLSLSLGGQLRVRWEQWDNFGFAPANDDDFGLFRVRLHGDLRAGDAIRVFIEAKSAESTSRDLPGGRRTLDVDTLDLQNAFLDLATELGGWDTSLRVGRQELSYGAQRLVSPLDWSNTRRTWDGARAIFQNDGWRVDVFATRPVVIEKYEFNEWNKDQAFYGVYAVHAVPDWKLAYDVYLLRLDTDLAAGDEERHTAGLRLKGTCALTGVEYDLEGGWQFGDAGRDDIEAWFFAAEAGYTFADAALKPRVHLGYDYASGDDDPADGTRKTFNQLYPLGHAYLGYIDVLGRQNIAAFSQGASCWLVEKKVQLRVDHHIFRRAERADAVYGVGGAVLREGDAGEAKDIGTEIDVTLSWKVDRNTQAAFGFSQFFAGDFIKESGPSEDVKFLHASVQYTF
ncbi:MAG TPA: alginate export family protein [Kiritimatiellia bacterium]|nr:alginate export family protein [Kiritimatiellia bacterium]